MREYSVDVNETQAKRVALDIARDDVSIPWLVKLIDVAFDNVIRQEDAFAALNRMFARQGYTLSHAAKVERPSKACKPNIEEEALGARIRRLRKANGWSQTKLSEHCGWGSQIRISNYEKGTREPSLDDLRVLADALGTNLSELVDVSAIKEPTTPVVDQGKKSKLGQAVRHRFQEEGEDDDLPSARELQRARKYPPVSETGPQVLAIINFNSIPMQTLRDSFEVTPEEYECIRNQQFADFGARWMHELHQDLVSTYKKEKQREASSRDDKHLKPVSQLRPAQMIRSQIVAELQSLITANPWLTKEELVGNFEFGGQDYDWIMANNHTKIGVGALREYLTDLRGGIAERAIEVGKGEITWQILTAARLLQP